ncbi:MAG: hypothetical protein O9262_14060 [Cyclobacteriaceae bacterium]|nr:hypothetical protein [Cyclobacteriaceae bacterium]
MRLTTILLDGAQGLIIIPFYFLVHMTTTVFIEGGILFYFKYKPFKKCLGDAFIVNLCSLVVGLFLIVPFQSIGRHAFPDSRISGVIITLSLFYIQTILVEGLVLKLLNKSYPFNKMIPANLLMNFITYVILYLILYRTEGF